MTSRNDVSPTYWVTDDDYPDICLFCHGTLQRLANLVNDDPFFSTLSFTIKTNYFPLQLLQHKIYYNLCAVYAVTIVKHWKKIVQERKSTQ